MRIACVYSEDDRKYRFYTAEQAPALIAVLLAASEVISFNGKAFDVLVLRRHYGLIGTLPRRGKHTDLHELLTERAGFRVSLNSAVALNFDEKKHTSGREMAKVNGTELS